MKLGSIRFSIGRNRTRKVRLRLSAARLRFVTQEKRLRATVKVRDRDSAGRPRSGTRTIVLKAPPAD